MNRPYDTGAASRMAALPRFTPAGKLKMATLAVIVTALIVAGMLHDAAANRVSDRPGQTIIGTDYEGNAMKGAEQP